MSQTLLSYHDMLDDAGVPHDTFSVTERLAWLIACHERHQRILAALDMPDAPLHKAVTQHIHDAAQLPGTLDDLTMERQRQLRTHALAIIFTVRDLARAQAEEQACQPT